MSRSSIFNFESFEGFRPRAPWTLVGVLAVVAGVEAASRLVPNDALMPANSSWGQLRFVEREVVESAAAPKVVFLGSSRMRDAAAPRVLEEGLGLPKGSVLNAALGGGRIFDALDLYKRNRGKLKGAGLFVIGLDDWHFSLGAHPLGTLYELDAPLSDRMRLPEPPRNAFVLDGIFQQRVKIPVALRHLSRLFSGKSSSLSLYVDEIGQVRDRSDGARSRTEQDLERDAARLAHLHYSRFRQSSVLSGHLVELVRCIQEDGGQVLLVELPNRSVYRRRVREDHEAEFQEHLALARDAARRMEADFIYYDRPEDCELRDEMYSDYGHLKTEGARAFTAFFLKELAARGLSVSKRQGAGSLD